MRPSVRRAQGPVQVGGVAAGDDDEVDAGALPRRRSTSPEQLVHVGLVGDDAVLAGEVGAEPAQAQAGRSRTYLDGSGDDRRRQDALAEVAELDHEHDVVACPAARRRRRERPRARELGVEAGRSRAGRRASTWLSMGERIRVRGGDQPRGVETREVLDPGVTEPGGAAAEHRRGDARASPSVALVTAVDPDARGRRAGRPATRVLCSIAVEVDLEPRGASPERLGTQRLRLERRGTRRAPCRPGLAERSGQRVGGREPELELVRVDGRADLARRSCPRG